MHTYSQIFTVTETQNTSFNQSLTYHSRRKTADITVDRLIQSSSDPSIRDITTEQHRTHNLIYLLYVCGSTQCYKVL